MAKSNLDRQVEDAVEDYLKRANRTALENMIGLCLHVMSAKEMVDFLREEADYIESDCGTV